MLGACGADDNGSSNSSSESSTAQSSTAKSTTESSAKVVAGGDLQDGTYKLEEKNYSNGYRAVFEMVVKTAKSLNQNMITSMKTANQKQKMQNTTKTWKQNLAQTQKNTFLS